MFGSTVAWNQPLPKKHTRVQLNFMQQQFWINVNTWPGSVPPSPNGTHSHGRMIEGSTTPANMEIKISPHGKLVNMCQETRYPCRNQERKEPILLSFSPRTLTIVLTGTVKVKLRIVLWFKCYQLGIEIFAFTKAFKIQNLPHQFFKFHLL